MELIAPIALLLLGFALIAVEVYAVPGVGVVGIAGGLAIVGGVVLAFVEAGLLGGVVAFAGAGVAGGGMFYLMWESGALDRFVLADQLRQEGGEAEAEPRSRLLGRDGTAVTSLRPEGVCEIDGERVEVQTEGGFIAAGSRVRVVAMDRRRFFVRLADDVERVGEAPGLAPTGSQAP